MDREYVHTPALQPPTPQQPKPVQAQQTATWNWDAWQTNWKPEIWDQKQDPRKPSRSASRRARARKQKEEKSGAPPATSNASPFGPIPDGMSPFASPSTSAYNVPSSASTPWPSAPAAPLMPTAPKRAPSPVLDPETLNALKSSYPDINEAPPKIKMMIEKAERQAVTSWQERMNLQTQKQAAARSLLSSVREAKENHRAAWLKHLDEIASQLKEHMDSFKQQQIHFGQLILKARMEVKEAGESITELNRQSNQDASHNKEEIEDGDHASDSLGKDHQESALRAKVQKALQECIDLTEETQVVDVEEEDEDAAPRKRARSKDPAPTDVEIGSAGDGA